jgi:hypothetical protein
MYHAWSVSGGMNSSDSIQPGNDNHCLVPGAWLV